MISLLRFGRRQNSQCSVDAVWNNRLVGLNVPQLARLHPSWRMRVGLFRSTPSIPIR